MAKTNSTACAAALTQNQIKRTVDKLAALKAQISNLETEADNLADLLKYQGEGVYFGNAHKFMVATVTGKRLDSALAQSFLTPAQLKKCMKSTSTTSGRLYAL
jgi:conjugal transfer/entry exclusion protein